jgi:hypothetical protein
VPWHVAIVTGITPGDAILAKPERLYADATRCEAVAEKKKEFKPRSSRWTR